MFTVFVGNDKIVKSKNDNTFRFSRRLEWLSLSRILQRCFSAAYVEAAPHTTDACRITRKDYIVHDPRVSANSNAAGVFVGFAPWLRNTIWINFSTAQPERRNNGRFLREGAWLKKGLCN
jgi:hypothetical protein